MLHSSLHNQQKIQSKQTKNTSVTTINWIHILVFPLTIYSNVTFIASVYCDKCSWIPTCECVLVNVFVIRLIEWLTVVFDCSVYIQLIYRCCSFEISNSKWKQCSKYFGVFFWLDASKPPIVRAWKMYEMISFRL